MTPFECEARRNRGFQIDPGMSAIGFPQSAHDAQSARPGYTQCHDAMEQLGIFEPVVTGRRGEFLYLRDFRIGVGFDVVGDAIGR